MFCFDISACQYFCADPLPSPTSQVQRLNLGVKRISRSFRQSCRDKWWAFYVSEGLMSCSPFILYSVLRSTEALSQFIYGYLTQSFVRDFRRQLFRGWLMLGEPYLPVIISFHIYDHVSELSYFFYITIIWIRCMINRQIELFRASMVWNARHG